MRLFASSAIINPETGEILALQGTKLTRELLLRYQAVGISYVDTLTVLESEAEIPDSHVRTWLQTHRPDPENGIKLVYKQLKDALENWETLAVELGVDLQTPDPLEDADYEYDEELTEEDLQKEREANQAMLDFAIESLGWA